MKNKMQFRVGHFVMVSGAYAQNGNPIEVLGAVVQVNQKQKRYIVNAFNGTSMLVCGETADVTGYKIREAEAKDFIQHAASIVP